jgi:hypothetical protein
MSKKDDEINRQLIFNSGGANPEDYLTPKQLKRYKENPDKFIDIDVDLAMNVDDPYESELKKEKEAENKRIEDAKDDLTEGKIRRSRRGRGGDVEQLDIPGIFEAESGFRTTAALGTEIFLNTLVDPFMEPTTQVAAGTLFNLIAQRIRGGELSKGELTAAGLASLIPGGAQGRAITQFAKGVGKGGLAGGIESIGMAGIDRGELPTLTEFGTSVGIGAAFGGALSTPQATKVLQDLRGRIKGQYTPIVVEAATKKPRPKIINRKPTLDRSDVEYVPTKSEIKGVMKELGLPEDDQRAAFVSAVFKKDVADIQATKKFLNDYIYRNTPKNLKGLAEAISAQEGVEYTVADLSNIIKDKGAVTTRMVGGMPKSAKRIRNLVDLQRVLKDRLRKIRQQPTYNKGHANSIGQILKKTNVAGGADRPDNIFIEQARSTFSKDAEGNIKLEEVGNISKKDIGDDPLVVQRMKGFSPTVQESILKLLRKQDLEVKRVYEGLGIDTSDLDVIENIDLSTAVRPEIRDWTEETVDDLVKAGVNPEKAVDYLLDINEELGDMLSAAGLREDMFLLFKREPGLAAQFLNELIGNKKRGSGKLKNIPISDFERQMLASIKDYFKENPLFKFKEVAKTVVKGITKPRPGEKREARKIIKKLPKEDK